MLPLPSHTVLDAFQHADNRIGRIISVHQRIGDDLPGRVHHDAGIFLAGREHVGQTLEESPLLTGNYHRILLDLYPLLYLHLVYDCIPDGNYFLDILRIKTLRVRFLPSLKQTTGIPSLTLQQYVDRIYFQELHGVRHQGPQRIHVIMGLIQRTIEVAELVLGHAYQLPQRLAFIEQGERIGDQVHLPACLMIRLVLLGHFLYYIINVSDRADRNGNQQNIA